MPQYSGRITLMNVNDGKAAVPLSYDIETNQQEILKFVNTSGQVTLSPEVLTATVVLKDPETEEPQRVSNLQKDKISIEFFVETVNDWQTLPIDQQDQILVVSQDSFEIRLQKLIEMPPNPVIYALLNGEPMIRIGYKYKKEDQFFNLMTFVNVRYGLNKDMASLSLKANGLVAAIQDTALQFDANGLTVNNGKFRILKKDGTQSLSADSEGNLTVIGKIIANEGQFSGELKAATGTFSGDISAATGTFKGTLKAKDGLIGGFNLLSGSLTSVKEDTSGIPFITLDGENGRITAKNITLGEGAEIASYIKIGPSVKILNAVYETDPFLTVTDKEERTALLSLNANGDIAVGNELNRIFIRGAEGSISSKNYTSNTGWRLDNKNSILNNVIVKGSIKASVMEYGKIQAVGGILLIRPSSQILSVKEYIVTVENANGFNVGDWCQVGEKQDQVYAQIKKVEKNSITLDRLIGIGFQNQPIINMGQNGSVGISINATENDFSLTPQAISIFDFNEKDKTTTPHIILGKLPKDNDFGYAGGKYGLYAENVLLKGSLVTQSILTGGKAYSGISTIYETNAPSSKTQFDKISQKEGVEFDSGEILIWAGAKDTSRAAIEDSKFFVDRNGNLFAGSGYFRGTIITDAKITASELETATITGSNKKENEPALTIRDTKKGILFTNFQGEKVFSINDDRMSVNTNAIIFNKAMQVTERGSLVLTNFYVLDSISKTLSEDRGAVKANVLSCADGKLSYSLNIETNKLQGLSSSYIDFKNGMSFSGNGKDESLRIQKDNVEMIANLKISQDVIYGENMQYKKIEEDGILKGYDLYID